MYKKKLHGNYKTNFLTSKNVTFIKKIYKFIHMLI